MTKDNLTKDILLKDNAVKDSIKAKPAADKTEANYLDVMKAAVVDALEDIKGFDISVMDVRKLTNMTSYMIVASATSSRQAKSMGDNVHEKMKEKGYSIRGTEGEKEGEWVLVDLNDIVVHIMVPATRAYYNLEQLWGDAEARRGHITQNNVT